jgi:serine/threonine protein kinase
MQQQQQQVAEGTFSLVLLDHTNTNALKQLHPICHPERILSEIIALATLGGHAHVSPLLGGTRTQLLNTIKLPYFKHNTFKEFYLNMNEHDLRIYMKHLFQSLQHLHKHGIIHRDLVSAS